MASSKWDQPHSVPHDPITSWPQRIVEKEIPDSKAAHPLGGAILEAGHSHIWRNLNEEIKKGI